MEFPCSSCGACCRRIGSIINNYPKDLKEIFPYKWDESGCCEMLTEDNKCKVYYSRPLLCNIDELHKFTAMKKTDFYNLNIEACNQLKEEDNIT